MNDLFYRVAGKIIAPFRYAERQLQQLKEEAKEDLQSLVAKAIKLVAMGIAGLMFLLFISVFLAEVLNRALENDYAGFAIVGGFYLLVAIGFYVSKEVSEHKKKIESNRRKAIHA